jgi:hypothetical protein
MIIGKKVKLKLSKGEDDRINSDEKNCYNAKPRAG